MRVLLLHNRYRQPGGEDAVFHAEAAMLRSQGIEVRTEEFDNEPGSGVLGEVALLAQSSWSVTSYRAVRRICREFRPHVAHVHNFWLRLSPAVHAACGESGAATVQTLHNFRLLCASATLMRDGGVCERCVGRIPWQGVLRRCYRGSFAASAAVSAMALWSRWAGTWEAVDAFIALTEHARMKFIEGGLPPARLLVKPNFVADPGASASSPGHSNVCLYAGRLSEEKGIDTLLEAWKDVGGECKLRILGDGPARAGLEAKARSLALAGVEFAGLQPPSRVKQEIAGARCVVLPSIWYEGLPVALLEAFSQGRPAVVSDLGALQEIVRHGHTGLTFPPADAARLAGALREVFQNGSLADRLGANARRQYLARYTAKRNFPRLMQIYRFAMERRGRDLPDELVPFQAAPVGAREERTVYA